MRQTIAFGCVGGKRGFMCPHRGGERGTSLSSRHQGPTACLLVKESNWRCLQFRSGQGALQHSLHTYGHSAKNKRRLCVGSNRMLLHIALVSITKEVTLAHLAPVSAAIQKQISRDFGPMWMEATVDAFDKLEDVPIGYWHVLLQDELPNGAAGLHKRDDNKQPFALVALTTNWPVFMSHERSSRRSQHSPTLGRCRLALRFETRRAASISNPATGSTSDIARRPRAEAQTSR